MAQAKTIQIIVGHHSTINGFWGHNPASQLGAPPTRQRAGNPPALIESPSACPPHHLAILFW